MASNLGYNYNCNLQEATALKNFRFFAQSCSQVRPVTLDNGDNRGQVGGVSNYDNDNYDHEEYNEEEYDESWDYDNDPVTIAFMKGNARGQRKGKGKKGNNSEGKYGSTVTCYTCGKQGHTSTFCYHNKGKSGKGQNKGQQSSYHYSQQPGKGYPQSPPCQQLYYPQPSTPQHPPSTFQPPKGCCKGYGKHWNKGGKKGQQ
eukprot:5426226-Amphidinium_carterae.1